jgi:putative transposase
MWSQTLEKAAANRTTDNILLHSDQGFQYTSRQYSKALKQFNIKPSMSRKGKCLDKACMESFFGHFKSECLYLNSFDSEEELRAAINEYIHFYNHERFQAKLNNLSPIEYLTQVA